MKRLIELRTAVRLALAAGVAASFAQIPIASAADQDQGAAKLQKVEVTGSRIKRTDIETAQPVQVINRQQIQASGLTSIGDILQKITSAGAALNTVFNNGGNGETKIDLRYLGSNRVLVLVNGRRMVNGVGGTGVDGSADLNTIPVSIIDHIEVLQDGASAVYGSDAMAGVVNIITIKNYNGAEASAYLGGYKEAGRAFDGKTQYYQFTMGTSSDRSSIVANVSYVKQDPIWAGSRDISYYPVAGLGTTTGSSGTPQGRFIFASSTTCGPGNTQYTSYYGTCDLTLKPGSPAKPSMSDFTDFTSTARFNYAPLNYVLTPQERTGIYTQGHYDINDNVTFSADVLFNNRKSTQLLAPSPLFIDSSGDIPNSSQGVLVIPASQPYNPFGQDLKFDPNFSAGTNGFLIGRRPLEAGPRVFSEDVNTFRFSGGFNGTFEAMSRVFDWDVNYIYATNDAKRITHGLFNTSRLIEALGGNCTSPCVPFNVFGGQGPSGTDYQGTNGTGTITPDMLNYVLFTAQDENQNTMRNYTANISGDLADLWAGPLGFAAGYEYRELDGFDQPDALIALGSTSGNVRQPTSGRYSVKSEYVEFDLPLLADMPMAQSLDLDVASRHSNYDTFGTNTSSRAQVKWKPIDDLLVRGTWSQGFRAPGIAELFLGDSDNFPNIVDPCNGGGTTAAEKANCVGVPATYSQPNGQIRTTVGGNPNLDPETSISRTLGFVWNPEFVQGLDVSLDYYHIELVKTITVLGGQLIMDGCYSGGNQALCSLISRNPQGNVTQLLDTNVNIGSTVTSGLDMGLNYKLPSTSFGDFKLSWNTTYVRNFVVTVPDLTGGNNPTVQDVAGFQRGGLIGGIPHFKSNVDVNWDYGNWNADWTVRYISELWEGCTGFASSTDVTKGTPLCTDPALQLNRQGRTVYHDVQVSYDFDAYNTSVSFGIRNIFDKQPPTALTAFANSFDPTLYDVPGRFPYLRISTRF